MKNINNQTLLQSMHYQGSDGLIVTNPVNDERIACVATWSSEQINHAVSEAKIVQVDWAQLPAKERTKRLRTWYERIIDNKHDLARLMTLEQGKPLAESLGEVLYAASFVEWFAEEAKRSYGATIPATAANKRMSTILQPVGLCAAITPWNFPLAMITRKAAPALAAGCGMLIKPAELTPLSALALAELAYQAGIPKALLHVVVVNEPTTAGDIFTTHPDIKKLSFTGSTQVGKLLLAQSSSTLKRTSMELGGNAPFIVFDDADVDLAVEGAMASKFRNAGQTCVCANRFYIHDDVYEQFVDKFLKRVNSLRMGDGLDNGVDVGPMISQQAKVNALAAMNNAIEQGARVISKPNEGTGAFLEPVVLVDVVQSMDIVHQELFAPIAPLIRFREEAEVIAMANDTNYGLAAYFYSQNINRINRVMEKLEFGMVGVNDGILSTEVAPFGGIKESGFGREGAREGLLEYMSTKYVCLGVSES